MLPAFLGLALLGFLVACSLTFVVRQVSRRLRAHDSPGVAGQVKAARRAIPNTGGIGVFWAIAIPLALGLAAVNLGGDGAVERAASILPTTAGDALRTHAPGMRQQTPLALGLLASLLALHVLGLIDDRRPMGPFLKLGVMALPALLMAWLTDTRLLTMLDAHAGGPWLSIALTVLWFLVVTNAMNFIDNMDGLSAGVAAIAGACFLATAVEHAQWFIAACLALLVGACAGFLVFNFPWRNQERGGGATIFLGDGGSLVLGFLLAFLTVRTTYVPQALAASPDAEPAGASHVWYAVFMPLCVLAVPIYDFLSVVILRVRQGKSPFVGDLQHLSHRLVRLGLSKRSAVVVIHLFTGVTGLSGILLASLPGSHAALAGAQVGLMLLALATFEFAHARNTQAHPRGGAK